MIPFAAAVTAAHADPVAASTNSATARCTSCRPEDVARRVDVGEGVAVERDAEPLGREAPAPVVANPGTGMSSAPGMSAAHGHVVVDRSMSSGTATSHAHDTLLPWRTARAAASRTSSVMWFRVPSSSSSPHRPVRQRAEVPEHVVLCGHRSPCRHPSIDSSGSRGSKHSRCCSRRYPFSASAVRGVPSETLRLTSRQASSLAASSCAACCAIGTASVPSSRRMGASSRPARSRTTWATRRVFVGLVTRGGAHQLGERSDRRLVRRAGLRDRHRRASPVGAHAARLKNGDLHPERSDLLGETDGEPGDGPLRRLVGGQARRRTSGH